MPGVDPKRLTQEEGWCWLEGAEVVAQALVTQALHTNGFSHGQQRIHTLVAAQPGKPNNVPPFSISHCSAVASAYYPRLPLPPSTGSSFCGGRKRTNSIPTTENSVKIKDWQLGGLEWKGRKYRGKGRWAYSQLHDLGVTE